MAFWLWLVETSRVRVCTRRQGGGVSAFVSSTAPLRRTRDGPPLNHHTMDLSDHQICDLEPFQEAKLPEPLSGSPGEVACVHRLRTQ